MATRTAVVCTAAEAIARIPDGAVVGIGGFVTNNKPMALLRALMRSRRRGLTIVAPAGSLEIDLLLARGVVDRLITSYCGAEALAPIAPVFAAKVGAEVPLDEVDLGTVAAMLRATAMGLPFLPVRGPLGTDIPVRNPRLRPLPDPFGGPDLLAAPALQVDFALIHAIQSDPYGNVQHVGARFLDEMLARAARQVIVQVERLIPNEDIKKNPGGTTLPSAFVDAVVVAPYGAHPFASHTVHGLDRAHLLDLAAAGKAYAKGDPAALQAYMERYIDGPADHAGYLEQVGFKSLLALGLEGGDEEDA